MINKRPIFKKMVEKAGEELYFKSGKKGSRREKMAHKMMDWSRGD